MFVTGLNSIKFEEKDYEKHAFFYLTNLLLAITNNLIDNYHLYQY